MKKALTVLVSVVFVFVLSGCNLFGRVSADWTWDAYQVIYDAEGDSDYENYIGKEYTVKLPAMGSEYSVWGTGTYTADSIVGTAAVHAGLIEFLTGGTVKIIIKAGQATYTGSTANGITSGDWGTWDLSYSFVE